MHDPWSGMGYMLLELGALLILLGGLLLLMGKIPGLGHLPGDIRIQKGNFSCFFPLGTMIVVSLILTLLLNLIIRLWR